MMILGVAIMSVLTTMKEVNDMAYETKVILISLAEIACKADSPKEIYKAIAKMANAEGVILKSYEEAKAELKED